MEYSCQNFKDGNVLTAECLNHIENGIQHVCETMDCLCGEGQPKKLSEYVEGVVKSNMPNDSINECANALKGTASGEAVAINDASPIEHELDIKVRSKNIFKPNPTLKTSDHKGITFEPQEDGGIHVYGTNDGTGRSWKDIYMEVPEGTYTLSGMPEGSSKTTYYMEWYRIVSKTTAGYDLGSGVTAKMNQTERCNFQLSIAAGMTVDFIVYPQLEEGTAATSYVPYIEDFSTVKVVECGKNLLNVANTKSTHGTHEIGADGIITLTKGSTDYAARMWWELGSYDEFVGKTLTCSLTQTESHGHNILYFYADYSSSKLKQLANATVATGNLAKVSLASVPENTGGWSKLCAVYYCQAMTTEGQTSKIKEPQVEFGTTATECEPYVERTEHTVEADGAVKGVVGKGKDITLYADTAGALIDCSYNKDANKVIGSLLERIAALEAAVL